MNESTEVTEAKPTSDWVPIKKEIRHFYFLPYLVTAILSPSIILLVYDINKEYKRWGKAYERLVA